MKTSILSKGQIVLPAELRELDRIEAGQTTGASVRLTEGAHRHPLVDAGAEGMSGERFPGSRSGAGQRDRRPTRGGGSAS